MKHELEQTDQIKSWDVTAACNFATLQLYDLWQIFPVFLQKVLLLSKTCRQMLWDSAAD